MTNRLNLNAIRREYLDALVELEQRNFDWGISPNRTEGERFDP